MPLRVKDFVIGKAVTPVVFSSLSAVLIYVLLAVIDRTSRGSRADLHGGRNRNRTGNVLLGLLLGVRYPNFSEGPVLRLSRKREDLLGMALAVIVGGVSLAPLLVTSIFGFGSSISNWRGGVDCLTLVAAFHVLQTGRTPGRETVVPTAELRLLGKTDILKSPSCSIDFLFATLKIRSFSYCGCFHRRKIFAGNRLAVVRNATDFSEQDMQKFAREMNFSETTFILINEREMSGSETSFPVRIFTPKNEIPFAGHPTLGTVFVIQQYILRKQVPELSSI